MRTIILKSTVINSELKLLNFSMVTNKFGVKKLDISCNNMCNLIVNQYLITTPKIHYDSSKGDLSFFPTLFPKNDIHMQLLCISKYCTFYRKSNKKSYISNQFNQIDF